MNQIDENKSNKILWMSVISGMSIIVFYIVNYMFLKIAFNPYEFSMFVLIATVSSYSYFKNMDFLNPLFYFPILYFLLYWIGNFNFNGLYPSIPQKMWELFLLGIIGFYGGSMLTSKIVFKRMRSYMTIETMSQGSKLILSLIFVVCVFSKMIIFIRNGIPMLSGNIDASRQSAAEDFGILKVISSAYPILSVYFFYDFIMQKKKFNNIRWLNIILMLIAVLMAVLEGSRILIIQMILPMFFIWNIKVRRLHLRRVVLYIFLILLFIGVNKFVRNVIDDPNYFSYVMGTRQSGLFGNIMLSSFTSFRVGIDCFRQLVNLVPQAVDYTHGQMFFNSILSVLPGKQIIIGYYVAQLLGLNFDGIGAATTILGLFYLDGGPVLILFGMMIFGALINVNYLRNIHTGQISLVNLASIYIIYYSIYCLRTNVMPNIDPILTIFYYIVFSYIIKKVK
ncbi:MAG: oligosaccharide repeat unit polymerase [Levilactobacillus sp.]|uniref:O-antigen polymerase n=1 Tax=Levilactobacillus sp. TaxID=2767919 RepID=UPI00258F6792|nr:O-antigen polymerase [Levilactobacillus sp.]MCH4123828.1 oligosaccharide repeat unit polymerase [Levilactobacillus sp.]MCI1553926.1 oligosaccharide repeat unit polymerase [Levilactobacillus sp.]